MVEAEGYYGLSRGWQHRYVTLASPSTHLVMTDGLIASTEDTKKSHYQPCLD